MKQKNQTIYLNYGHRPQHTARAKRQRNEAREQLTFVALFVLVIASYVLLAGVTS